MNKPILIQYEEVITEVGEAQQFLCSMISSDTVYEQRPVNEPTVTEILEFMLQKEIQATADMGAYSGITVSTTVMDVLCVMCF